MDTILPISFFTIIPIITIGVCIVFLIMSVRKTRQKEIQGYKLLASLLFVCSAVCWFATHLRYIESAIFNNYLETLFIFILAIPLLTYNITWQIASAKSTEYFKKYNYVIYVAIVVLSLGFDIFSDFTSKNHSGKPEGNNPVEIFDKQMIIYAYSATCLILCYSRILKRYFTCDRSLRDKIGRVCFMILFCTITTAVPVLCLFEMQITTQALPVLAIATSFVYILFSFKCISGEFCDDQQLSSENDWACENSTDEALYIAQNEIGSRYEYGNYSSELLKDRFEEYIKQEKPYTNPKLNVSDVAKHLHSNRSYISSFINESYGKNFSRYMNRLRLQEYEYLESLPENSGLNKQDLAIKAGFGSYRNSTRVRNYEREIADKELEA